VNIILRRRKLGRTSCKEIAKHVPNCLVVRNDRDTPSTGVLGPVPKLFRWGTTSNVPEGYDIINQAAAIHEVNDKSGFRMKLMQEAPDTIPKTWIDIDVFMEDTNPWNRIDDHIPVIVRPRMHSQGRNLYKCDTIDALYAAVRRCGEGYYISQYIPKVAEYRVFVVSGRVCWVANKTPANPDAIAWNVAAGGRFDNVGFGDWPLRVVKCAIEAFNVSGLDFGGVDVMVDAEGKPYVLEINSAPSQTSPYRQECTGKCFAYIVAHGKQCIPLIQQKGGWRKWIHPAISQEAILVN
jgi:glutathione synthase/RimK-type ligase-like ATP-grasp enzyme